MFGNLLKLFRVGYYVKIPGKNFDNLSDIEFAVMIDAHLNEGNDEFDESALTEFTLMKYQDSRLESLRQRINDIQNKYKTAENPDGLLSEKGVKKLRLLKTELKLP